MSCCGEPRAGPSENGQPKQQNGYITQQPGPVSLSAPYSPPPFQPPNVNGPVPPPPVHQSNGYQAPSQSGGVPGMWGEARTPSGQGVNQWTPQMQQQQLPQASRGDSFNPYASGGAPGQTQYPPSPPPSTYKPGMNPNYPQSTSPGPPSSTPYLDSTIVRPMPIYPSPGPDGRGQGSPGSPGTMRATSAITVTRTQNNQQGLYDPLPEDGRLSVSVDFGTTFSGVAYGSSRIAQDRVQQILNWPGSFEHFRKIPTCLLYDDIGNVLSWGLEAKNTSPMEGTVRCEWFKLFLEPTALRDSSSVDQRLPRLPPGKQPIDLIVDFLSCIWQYAKQQIQREIGAVADLESADVWLTVPAAWDVHGCAIMRDAAIQAGLVRATKADDETWRDRLRIITEPEAAAVHCVYLTNLHNLRPSQNFMICDAGGGTVDLAVYKIIGQLSHLEIAEICARSGANCGSLFLDFRFRELVRTLLVAHPAHLDPVSLAYFMHNFSETEKLSYAGEEDDDKMFHFTCFNVEDPDDPAVGLVNGELAIPGRLLRREVFDPVVQDVLNLIEEQSRKVDQTIHALLMVGGFSGSEYLFRRVEAQFGGRMRVVRPADADTATCRGAAKYGLARRPLVQSVIAPKAYLMKVKLPAESEDWMKRPAYIKKNDAGVDICENRLQYLVQKGAILRKGQRINTKFCKFSTSSQDRYFVAVLYTADNDRVMRYTDEGETDELCKWSVDLSSLPNFQQAAQQMSGQGFYTEFELGLELDSAEVRGVLLYNGQEWGKTVFDFLN